MSESNVEHFDSAGFPLSGRRLVEASAGTGKTYSIAHLVLRLVLGVGEGLDFSTPRRIEEILVVTFTRAAAGELRGRIRALVEKAWRDLRAGHSDDPRISALIDDDPERMKAMLFRLQRALVNMDEAGISTIHSFAVKAAASFLFETGAIDDVQLSHTGGERSERIVTDLFRRLAASTGAPGLVYALLGRPQLEDFRKYWNRVKGDSAEVRPALPPGDAWEVMDAVVQAQTALCQAHQDLADEWSQAFPLQDGASDRAATKAVLVEALGELEDSPVAAGRVTNIIKYIEKNLALPVDAVAGAGASDYFKDLAELQVPPGTTGPVELLVRVRDHLFGLPDARQEVAHLARAAVYRTLVQARAGLDLRDMSLDEVITLINQRLDRDDTRPALQAAIAQAYPVCLVDEFQDTDPEQFRMFKRIYDTPAARAPGAGLFMIGDPKQSIYGFRGADIFAYLDVRGQVASACAGGDKNQGIYDLDTNWRSRALLVQAVNALFAEPPAGDDDALSFVFKGMPFTAVRSCEEAAPGRIRDYRLGGESPMGDEALVFIGHPAERPEKAELNGDPLKRLYARDTAARISALLDPVHGAKTVGADGEEQPLTPGDIAVLVRSAHEARDIRQALAQPDIGLRSVFASQRDSVFSDSEVSEDLLLVLMAMDQCTDRRRLKSALATPLMRGFGYGFDELANIEIDDDALEAVIAEFGGYRETWLRHGVLAAINQLLSQPARRLLPAIARREDSDRLFTDLRHLGDLLQQRDLDCATPEQLVDWYADCLRDDSHLDEDVRRVRLESDEDLVKIVTIHVAKGLEYPVVFLPFFFMPWNTSLDKGPPLYREDRGDHWQSVVEFGGDTTKVTRHLERERLAEDMRLLYVAMTRAVYQCHVGISASYRNSRAPQFAASVWGHLLALPADENGAVPDAPSFAEIRIALEQRFGGAPGTVGYAVAGEVGPVRYQAGSAAAQALVPALPAVQLPQSHWRITSYTGLVRGEAPRLGVKDDDDGNAPAVEVAVVEDDSGWADNIRFALPGSANTGSCLHDILETYALTRAPAGTGEPAAVDLGEIARQWVTRYGLETPGLDDTALAQAVTTWMNDCLHHPFEGTCLDTLFAAGCAIPEMRFDFAIGGDGITDFDAINAALAAAGQAPVHRYGPISGLMTGAIDLTFVHDGRIYVVDYKSNTLGRAPRFYDHAGMGASIAEHRYDLQYMIYAVAAHRHFRRRLGERYGFDDGEFRFGGVYYLFLRGMGLADYPDHGAWFTRPSLESVERLDRALAGDHHE
ncbi:AAA family ATPase [Marinihelvus fidelis]|uniref:RecBCD enzyme subunit RecB n=1 Tax=Marinihelvus fidelis TaxID=2613842 RepID=A0A5N0T8V3_9GAMM|nr:UvrD-helicase domain-containing protein [Marinihelvus fidelis]KAA9131463.1 AAA family ATPase [Marinihelvus fidelis]